MDFSPILTAPLAVKFHLVAALIALLFGIAMWVRPKGTASHKMIGRIFAGLMIVAAFSAIFIRDINNGSFSLIHLFVPLTFLGVYNAIDGIRNKNMKRHLNAVKGLFFGALLIPGLVAFMPGRRLWAIFFG